MKLNFEHIPHPHIKARQKKCEDSKEVVGFNAKIALALTNGVGTMWCAYAFAVLALFALPDALKGGPMVMIQWVSQTFIQLVMLSVIMVGQNILSQASDKRAQMTYDDADATFHEAQQIQSHLQQQDDAMNALLDRLEKIEANFPKPK